MIDVDLFVLALACISSLGLSWAYRVLPREEWQILATVPRRKHDVGWEGANLTYYGLISATAYATGLAVFLLLCGAMGQGVTITLGVIFGMMVIVIPASKLLAGWVEKKKHTFTIGGAVFVGFLVFPLTLLLAERLNSGEITGALILPMTAAVTIAYVIGEAIGRLACISFGCCYGRPIPEGAPSWIKRAAVRFWGATKKISYASNLEGVPVIPVQALGSSFLMTLGLGGVWLFLRGEIVLALGLMLFGSQSWRFVSEHWRADHRGNGRWTAYQKMSLVMVLAGAFLLFSGIEAGPSTINLQAGLTSLWNPLVILFLQAVWMIIFFFMGWSQVTGSTLSFHVHEDRI